MSNFSLDLSLDLLYPEPPAFSFADFRANEALADVFTPELVSESPERLVMRTDDWQATYEHLDTPLDYDLDDFARQAELLTDTDFHLVRADALAAARAHAHRVRVTVETDREMPFLEIQGLFFAAMYLTDLRPPLGAFVRENELLLSFGDFEEYAVNQVSSWNAYLAWVNLRAHEGKKKTTVYTRGVTKLGERDLELSLKPAKVTKAYQAVLNTALGSLSTTSSYEDGEKVTAGSHGTYEFEEKKSKHIDGKILRMEKW